MSNNSFLRVDKYLLKTGLNPSQILIMSQVMEYNRNTGDCFISDKTLAENFGISVSTVSREIGNLKQMGLITVETNNVKGGKERHMKFNATEFSNFLEEKMKEKEEKIPLSDSKDDSPSPKEAKNSKNEFVF